MQINFCRGCIIPGVSSIPDLEDLSNDLETFQVMVLSTLKINCQLFYQSDGFIWEHQRIAILDKQAMAKPQACMENKGGRESWGDSSKQNVHWRQLGVSRVMAAHWLSCNSLSLAVLLLGCFWGRQNSSLLLKLFLLKQPKQYEVPGVPLFFPVGFATDKEWWGGELPCRLPDARSVRFLFINFHNIQLRFWTLN